MGIGSAIAGQVSRAITLQEETMEVTFRWFSPLGASVAMYLVIGLLWFFIGLLTAPLLDRDTGGTILFVSERTDKAYFGGEPRLLMQSDPALAKLKIMLLTVIAGFLLLSGLVFISLAWFGVRERQLWAVLTLGIAGTVAVIFWGIALLPYSQAKIPLTLADLPPFIWLPTLLIIPATVLGIIGATS
jgi:hypothetical protein